jgi:diguanylate cyclase (GGDEF)-like protein
VTFAFTGAGVNKLRQRLSDNNLALLDAIEQVHHMAIRDELTGLFNRRHVMDLLKQQKALADSGGYAFCICYLDLDHFKQINDNFGHGVGDQVLIRFSQVMASILRDADDCGRLGGEEFIMILSRTELENAAAVAERLRHSLSQASFSDLSDKLSVTVSIGITEYKQDESIEHALSRADNALYQAKQGGRDQVVTCDSDA